MGPSVLLFGGIQQLGRHIMAYILESGLSEDIRVLDYEHPDTAYLSRHHRKLLKQVDFRQMDLGCATTVQRAFERRDGQGWDFVINASFEGEYQLTEKSYCQRIMRVAELTSREAKARGCRAFIQLSYGIAFRYASSMGLAVEKDFTESRPHFIRGQSILEAERVVQIPGLPVVILRYAEVYGPDLTFGLAFNIPFYRIYAQLGDVLNSFADPQGRMSTVHVQDVARATWHACLWKSGDLEQEGVETEERKDILDPVTQDVSIFHLADDGDSRMGTISEYLGNACGSSTNYSGRCFRACMLSALRLNKIREAVNTRHNTAWMRMLEENNVHRSPFIPYIHPELLHHFTLGMEGSLFSRQTGFAYAFPRLTQAAISDVVDGWIRRGLLP
ncbi:hypothetical protein BJ684DRAFT_8170 [Piptocephalis cylindrospora]|uniref:NAD-dependent epimerase/dehydratase domain-containing protein n=1 Tax=Piptocephalis cylindrospora TaxID=1907219 RepID=A0A4P9Y6J7_9FUNG|nr:hypothetical protein BJ684DRAFT_8170 [Piptocephalis cylindrospora]|eukprot:RKP14677.1 hypothetical protein BJ684DRAFT_8170 [Piptocephalis cylindrospora]